MINSISCSDCIHQEVCKETMNFESFVDAINKVNIITTTTMIGQSQCNFMYASDCDNFIIVDVGCKYYKRERDNLR